MKEYINYVGHVMTCLRAACYITERATNEAKHQLQIGIYLSFGWTKTNLLERDLNLRPPDWRAGALPTELN